MNIDLILHRSLLCCIAGFFSLTLSAQLDFETNLPILIISTNESIPDEPKINGQLAIIWNTAGALNRPSDPATEYSGPIAIEIRGQSSQFFFPKVGYGFETRDLDGTDLDTSFLNFPKEEDWILHGPFSDKTLMRNALAMHLGKATGSYHSRTRHVELILNDDYLGVYLLMEKIKQDKSRIDIANLKEEDLEGDELTGGYVIKIDKGSADWYSDFELWDNFEYTGFQYVSPNRTKIQESQRSYIQSYVDSFERALAHPNLSYGGKHYTDYIDLNSFADHFLLKELAKDVDAYRISSYYYKDKDSKDGKFSAGPAWDFNIAFGNVDYCDGDYPQGWMYWTNCGGGLPFWWDKLFNNVDFRNRLKCRWSQLSEGGLSKDSIFAYIDKQKELLEPAAARNFERWPILSEHIWPNPVVTGSYDTEVDNLKEFINDRWNWINENLPGTCNVDTDDEAIEKASLIVYPNPASETLIINIQLPKPECQLKIIDALGQVFLSRRIKTANKNELYLDLSNYPTGLYNIFLGYDQGNIVNELFIVR